MRRPRGVTPILQSSCTILQKAVKAVFRARAQA